jgi:hypothetical protein
MYRLYIIASTVPTRRFNRDVLVKPPRLPLGLFQWVFPVFNHPEEDIMRVAGLDTVVFTRMLKLGEQFVSLLKLHRCIDTCCWVRKANANETIMQHPAHDYRLLVPVVCHEHSGM